jgi:hypothetical protein
MSTICRDCEAIVVADDDVPADLVRIAMANHERFCKPGRREICDICDDVDFITSSGETNIHAVLSRLTGFRNPTPGVLDQHLRRHNRHDLTARLPGLRSAKPISTQPTTHQPKEKIMSLHPVPEAGRPPAAALVNHDDKRIAKAAQKVMAAETALDAAWEANAEKAELRAKRDRLKKQLAEIEAQIKGTAPTADPKKIRAWAAENGYDVAPSGIIPKAIMADYLDATSGGAA